MQTIEIIGAVIGLAYLYLEYKANIWLWPVGVLMPLVYGYIFYHSKFYADMGINVYYFFASIYGWLQWSKNKSQQLPEANITYTPKHLYVRLSVIFIILFTTITFILIKFTDSPVPFGDGFTTALSIVAMWMLAKKYIEQWLLWIVVNVVSFILFFWKGLYPTAILFIVYSIIPIFGYLKWKKMTHKGSEIAK